ncbi:hypothetical protein [Microcystis aeruginosa]|uniref:hypothetical protein n=1 Tax=Microcystis aeruginosa TaxID=1126 RepID=UPI001483C7C4|nr:hypothetical protein [Microcystis aeruginosa]
MYLAHPLTGGHPKKTALSLVRERAFIAYAAIATAFTGRGSIGAALRGNTAVK